MSDSTNESQIRSLIENWANAVHTGDMDTVLKQHDPDIVMFDVPPPYEGIRGIDAYRKTWPPFFEWQAQGSSFEIESLEITAGEEVAFAYALLRCGTAQELEKNPENRLRLTLGLSKQQGQWTVMHEHHSFPFVAEDTAAEPEESAKEAEQSVRKIHQNWFEQTAQKNLDGIMAHIDNNIVSYEHDSPLQYKGREHVREVCKYGLESASGAIKWDIPDLEVMVHGDLAVAWGLNHMVAENDGKTSESWSRGTRIFQRRDGDWQLIHQHVSYPYDPETGEARLDLQP